MVLDTPVMDITGWAPRKAQTKTMQMVSRLIALSGSAVIAYERYDQTQDAEVVHNLCILALRELEEL